MPRGFGRIIETLGQHRVLPVIRRCTDYVQRLSPGDRFIAGVLAGLVIVTSLAGLYALERSFLVVQPAYGGSLTEGVVGSPRFVNPLLALTDADRDLTALTYAGLMGWGADGNLVPTLAERYVVSPDGKTYTFTLRKTAAFSDGSPVTADDVVFTITKAQDSALKSPEFANWANIRVEAVDARTVRFTLPKAYAPFLEDTTLGIMPARLWRGISDEQFPFTTLATSPVGTGPFMVSHIVRDKTGLITGYDLVANTHYALGRPYLDSMHVRFYANATDLAAARKRGAVESAYGLPVVTDSDTRTLTSPYARIFGVFFNQSHAPVLSHPEVREALSVAIDRTALVQDMLGGYATAVDGPVPPGSGIPESPVVSPADRIATAAKILKGGGWSYDGDARRWTKGKETLTITLRTSSVPELKAISSAVRDDWAVLGVPTEIQLYEPGDLAQSVIRTRNYDALLFGMVIGRSHDLYAFWDSAARSDPGLNVALYANKTVDSLLERMRTESDPVAAASDLARINALIAADYPAAFLYAPDFLYIVPKDLHGVVLTQIASPSDRFATVATWYRQTEEVWPFLARAK